MIRNLFVLGILLLFGCQNSTSPPTVTDHNSEDSIKNNATPKTPEPEGDSLYNWTSNLRVRSQPSLKSEVITKIPFRKKLYWTGVHSENREALILRGIAYDTTFYEVLVDGKKGWVYGACLQKNDPLINEFTSGHWLPAVFVDRLRNKKDFAFSYWVTGEDINHITTYTDQERDLCFVYMRHFMDGGTCSVAAANLENTPKGFLVDGDCAFPKEKGHIQFLNVHGQEQLVLSGFETKERFYIKLCEKEGDLQPNIAWWLAGDYTVEDHKGNIIDNVRFLENGEVLGLEGVKGALPADLFENLTMHFYADSFQYDVYKGTPYAFSPNDEDFGFKLYFVNNKEELDGLDAPVEQGKLAYTFTKKAS